MINFQQLLEDHNINFSDREFEWLQIQCPYCISSTTGQKKHGGFNLSGQFYNCRKCGWHPLEKIISSLMNISPGQTKTLLKEYSTNEKSDVIKKRIVKKETFCLPKYCGKMEKSHKEYLKKRKFDPDKLEKEWGLLGTNHCGNYKFRIVAPIFLDNKIVSFQSRDITNKSEMRYKVCKTEIEIIHHKHILYGIDKLSLTKHKDRCIIVEGITGSWRLGAGCLATFGIGFTQEQILFLVKRKIKLAFIMFDPEEIAQQRAEQFSILLSGFGIEVKIVDISKDANDPGELSQKQANLISKELLK